VKYDRPVHELMIECAGSLHEPFTREGVTQWFRQNYPDIKATTIGAHITGLTVGRNPNSFPSLAIHPPVFERVGRGLYRRARGGPSAPGRPSANPVTSPTEPRTRPAVVPRERPAPNAVLVGCVKSKRPLAGPAKDLYSSTLFARRRRYAEASGAPWFVVSSRWGLVAPDEVIAPYDVFLGDMSAAYRRAWAEFVVTQLTGHVRLSGASIEIHAGDHYVAALRPAIEGAGAELIDPVDAHSMGETLAWYDAHRPWAAMAESIPSDPASHPKLTEDDEADAVIDRLVVTLRDQPSALTPTDLRALAGSALAHPGLYSWWSDDAGAADLARGLGHPLAPGLIYAGQAGATRWPSGKPSINTLRGRLVGMHLGGRANLSTFRLTLAAILSAGWDGVLDEERLTAWMEEHLAVIPVPIADADTLGVVEDAVLAKLDPPLNLMHMPKTPLRREVSRLRKALG